MKQMVSLQLNTLDMPEQLNEAVANLRSLILDAMRKTQDTNSVIGALILCEDMSSLLKVDNFQYMFEPFIQAFKELTDQQIGTLKESLAML